MTFGEKTLSNWFVVQTHANGERKARANLVRQGFETYLPLYRKTRRHARRREIVAAPLFPGYMFVSVDIGSQRWRALRSTIGVSRLVCNGDEPARLPVGIVEALQSRHGDDGLIDIGAEQQFSFGDKVRITDGAFRDCLGAFEKATDSERVLILLDLLGRKVRIAVHGLDVVPA